MLTKLAKWYLSRNAGFKETYINISKVEGKGSEGKGFPLSHATVNVLHDLEKGKNIVTVEVNGLVEFKYDFNNPEEAVYGYFSPSSGKMKTIH